MSQGNDQDKTEAATPKRRQEAREKGQVANSKELASVTVLLGSLGTLFFLGSDMVNSLMNLMRWIFDISGTFNFQEANIHSFFLAVLKQTAVLLFPLAIIIVVAGIAGNVFQVGFLFTLDSLVPKFSKIDPIKGFKKLFSARSLVEVIKSVFKIIIVGYIAFLVIENNLHTIPTLIGMDVGEVLSFAGKAAFHILCYTTIALVALSAFDYWFQRWEFEKNLRMSKQEIKEEIKQREGDPLIKARIRNIQMEIARRRMMNAIPDADVVITNPTRLAVAIQYDDKKMIAPKVIGKGAGFIAEQIKEIARGKGIPIVEDKPLAQTLYKVAEIGDLIPENLYRVVAEILAYVYRIKAK